MDKRVTTGRISRRKHDEAFKRELVERSLQPGASVAAIAQDGGINANLLFNWRRLHLRRGALTTATASAPTLLPVTVQEHVAGQGKSAAGASRAPSGVIEIDIGAARVRVRGVVDDATVRSVLQALGDAA